MIYNKKRNTNHTITLNLAWNEIVHLLINRGVYKKFTLFDQSKIAIRFFGTVPGIVWNGGRKNKEIGTLTVSDLIEHVLWLNKQNVGFNFTFSSTLIDDKLLNDTVANEVLRECQSPMNGVVCASHLLCQYIKDQYPKYKRVSSCILSYYHTQDLEKLFDKFDIIVLPEDYNPDFDYLAHLNNPGEIEIILNSNCIFKCPFRAEHYEMVHDYIKSEMRNEKRPDFADPCAEIMAHKQDWVFKNGNKQGDKQFVLPQMLSRYFELGITHFKFLDRGSPPDLELLLNYWNALRAIEF